MVDPKLLTTSPGSSATGAAVLPPEWDYELPTGFDPVPRSTPPTTLDEAEAHFRPWIDAFPDSWEDDQSRWSRKVFGAFVLP